MSSRSLILVLADGAPETERTVRYAVSLAKRRDADLHAIQVVPRDGAWWPAPANGTSVRARLEALRPAAWQAGVSVRIVTLAGVPERAIPAYARLHGASLVVIGRHYGSSRLWRNGAVASRLSRSSPVPVLVAPARGDAPAPLSPTHIVAAVDFTVASAIALRTAVRLSTQHGARLTLLHAMTPPAHMMFSGGEAWRFTQHRRADAMALAERLKRRAAALGARDAEPVVVTGDASRGIAGIAAVAAADLIVMGVAPRGWLDEALSGSTLRAVLRRTAAPVLVLPVIGGAYGWIDEAGDDWERASVAADAAARRAA